MRDSESENERKGQHESDPVAELLKLKEEDPKVFDEVVKAVCEYYEDKTKKNKKGEE